MEGLMRALETVNGILWHDTVLYTLVAVGVLFTVWSGFGQYRALTHGVAVIRGRYDRRGDPGAISHFQALSAALSATVGLGNVAGVAIAVSLGVVAGLEPFIDTLCVCTITALVILLSGVWNRPPDAPFAPGREPAVIAAGDGEWTLESGELPSRRGQPWRPGEEVFTIVRAGRHADRGTDLHRLPGVVVDDGGALRIEWQSHESPSPPALAAAGVYAEYKGATLTARAFDRVIPGLGFVLVPAVAWLFALSTMISWSYYGEQGVIFLFGRRAIQPYRLVYCLLILVACSPLIRTETELDVVSSLGTGVMLFANIPIMLIFGAEAMRAYRSYFRRLDAGELDR